MVTSDNLIHLSKNKSQVIINLLGFKVNLFQLEEKVILNKFVRGDGKTASSHPCLPVFGPETETNHGLSQHGKARTSLAEIIEQTSTTLKLEHKVNEGTYPIGLIFRQSFTLINNKLVIESIFTNNSEQPLPLNFAEHFYWNAPNGWEGLRINNKNVADLVKKDKGFTWESKNIISNPGQNDILLEQENLPYCQLWAYSENKEYDHDYVCIEPARGRPRSSYFGSAESMLKPGETFRTEIKISLK